MQSIQNWFEKIIGVPLVERDRWTLVQQVFSRRRPELEALHKPACWRRKPAVAAIGGRN